MLAALLVVCAGQARADDQHVVSLTCRGMTVQKAISILQTVSDLRVVVDPKVPDKRITLSLKDLPPEDALKTIVAAAGLTYRKVGNAFLVERMGGAAAAKNGSRETPEPTGPTTHGAAAPGLVGGIVHPDQPEATPGAGGLAAQQQAPVVVSHTVLAALEHTVEVDVKNGPLTEVMEQLSRSTGIKVVADPSLSAGLVATVGLHGIPLKNALEMVAGQTGLQISPRPEGVAFVTPGFSLDAAQARTRRAPAGAKLVEQGQLWTAEWASVLSSGISAFDGTRVIRSLRRQSLHPDGRPLQFRPRSGGLHQLVPATPPAAGSKRALEKRRPTLPAGRTAQPTKAGSISTEPGSNIGKSRPSAAAVKCPHGGRQVRAKVNQG